MIKKALFIIVLIVAAFSCKPDANKSLQSLRQLTGTWAATDNTVVYFKFEEVSNKLQCSSFSLQNGDTLLIDCYSFDEDTDTLLLYMGLCGKSSNSKVYHLKKDWFGKFVFEATYDVYPYRIVFDRVSDSLWRYEQENIRGNKNISFTLKRQ